MNVLQETLHAFVSSGASARRRRDSSTGSGRPSSAASRPASWTLWSDPTARRRSRRSWRSAGSTAGGSPSRGCGRRRGVARGCRRERRRRARRRSRVGRRLADRPWPRCGAPRERVPHLRDRRRGQGLHLHGSRQRAGDRHPRRDREHADHARPQAEAGRRAGRACLRPRAAAHPRPRVGAQPGLDEPDRQRDRRRGRARHDHAAQLPRRRGSPRRGDRRRPRHPERARPGCWSRSSPPRSPARAPASGSTSRAGSSRGTAAASRSSLAPARPALPSGSLSTQADPATCRRRT